MTENAQVFRRFLSQYWMICRSYFIYYKFMQPLCPK